MSFDRFATAMIAAGAGLGLAVTSLVPTSAHAPERLLPSANAADYPEITAVSYESYPVATVPLFHRGPMRLASWEKPWLEPPARDEAYPLPEDIDYDGDTAVADPQVEEDYESADGRASPVDEVPVEPVELTLADHP
ncbi:hypothetical protein [Novosphingobium jiangmenense]|uniref:Uncharacterized protein n=1 Tax=Novosphingobium jiangmenense TaxID=2791981 RepID=A0ABS0HGH6_9SPHN|nr:hypothetical protein [Novosphingobium jiangmenense]MBF9151372.1 hypothetical protein [Novosphingobium jiangmenense]